MEGGYLGGLHGKKIEWTREIGCGWWWCAGDGD